MNTMLNDQQYERLAPYEPYFATALRTSYPRSPGPRALREIHAVLREIDPQTPTLNTTCGTCILRVLKKAGRYYFDRKEAIERETAEAVAATIEAVTAANATPAAAAAKSNLVPPAAAPETPEIKAPKSRTGKSSTKTNKAKKSKK